MQKMKTRLQPVQKHQVAVNRKRSRNPFRSRESNVRKQAKPDSNERQTFFMNALEQHSKQMSQHIQTIAKSQQDMMQQFSSMMQMAMCSQTPQTAPMQPPNFYQTQSPSPLFPMRHSPSPIPPGPQNSNAGSYASSPAGSYAPSPAGSYAASPAPAESVDSDGACSSVVYHAM